MALRIAEYPLWLRAVVVATLLLFAINIIFFLGPLISFATAISSSIFLTWVGSLFATFLGAYFAFRFSATRSRQEQIEKETVAGNLALSALVEIWDRQKQYQRDILEPYRGKPDAWLNLAVGTPLDAASVSLNRNDLAFVLQRAGSIWQKVVMEERRYLLVGELIKQRENMIINEIWPKLAGAGISMAASAPETHIEMILGPAYIKRLKSGCEAIFKIIDENVISSRMAFNDLRATLIKIHPGQKFIDMREEPLAE